MTDQVDAFHTPTEALSPKKLTVVGLDSLSRAMIEKTRKTGYPPLGLPRVFLIEGLQGSGKTLTSLALAEMMPLLLSDNVPYQAHSAIDPAHIDIGPIQLLDQGIVDTDLFLVARNAPKREGTLAGWWRVSKLSQMIQNLATALKNGDNQIAITDYYDRTKGGRVIHDAPIPLSLQLPAFVIQGVYAMDARKIFKQLGIDPFTIMTLSSERDALGGQIARTSSYRAPDEQTTHFFSQELPFWREREEGIRKSPVDFFAVSMRFANTISFDPND